MITCKDFSTDHLDEHQRKIAQVILDAAFGADEEDCASGGGCRAFYTPQEWEDRGEQYGQEAELIVVYDGGDLGYYFNMDRSYDMTCMAAEAGFKPEPYATYEKMRKALEAIGFYAEECTGWYSAIYKK